MKSKKSLALVLVVALIVVCSMTLFACNKDSGNGRRVKTEDKPINYVENPDDYDFELSEDENSYIVTSYHGADSAIKIPSKYNGKPVTSIGYCAFAECSGLTSVTIGNSVKEIGEGAFYYCNSLTSVTIPNSVTSIGSYAFCDCSGLTSITIPDSVTSIGYRAFCDCSGLTSITIPNSVTSIGDRAFYYCNSLTSVTIPNSVTSIGEDAFHGCRGLTSVTIGNSVTSIGYDAFYYCSGLTSITIPDSVTSIGEYAFYYCSSLKNVFVYNSTMTIGDNAFEGCDNLVYNENDNGYYFGNAKNPYVLLVKTKKQDFKIGLICLHDENSTYDKNFIDAMIQAQSDLGLTNEQVIIATGIPEGDECYQKACEFAEAGCNIIFADSFGHEQYMIEAAKQYPDVQFCHALGFEARNEDLDNYHNVYASIYEGRYLTGYAAGLKLLTMTKMADENNNFKVGFIGAYPYAEVISSYTAWYLGIKDALAENSPAGKTYTATMEVEFSDSWYYEDAEKEIAEKLISRGCVLISQYSDSMGAPNACEKAGVPNVSYNGSTLAACPDTFIASSRINWAPYFEMMIENAINGTEIPTNYTGTLKDGSVEYELGYAAVAGTANKLAGVEAELKAGTRFVFDCSKFTVEGEHLTEYLANLENYYDFVGDTNVIKTKNGITYFAESDSDDFRSAPYFDILQIDGITTLNVCY